MKNANLASLYIGTLQEENNSKIRIYDKLIWIRTENFQDSIVIYHDINVSPNLSHTVKTATKILQHKKIKQCLYHYLQQIIKNKFITEDQSI
jgi:hypothetical protein